MKKRTIALLLACVMTLGVAIGGTLAWLIDDTDPVENTFTPSDIDIKLEETGASEKDNQWEKSYKMVPGDILSKDPKVTVKANSEACWLFVKMEKSSNFDNFMTCAVITGDDAWTALDGVTGVYWRKVAASTADQTFNILAGNTTYADGIVTVNTDVTKEMMNALVADDPTTPGNESTYPTLTFTAYAIQQAHIADSAPTDAENAAAAWAEINKPATPNP